PPPDPPRGGPVVDRFELPPEPFASRAPKIVFERVAGSERVDQQPAVPAPLVRLFEPASPRPEEALLAEHFRHVLLLEPAKPAFAADGRDPGFHEVQHRCVHRRLPLKRTNVCLYGNPREVRSAWPASTT